MKPLKRDVFFSSYTDVVMVATHFHSDITLFLIMHHFYPVSTNVGYRKAIYRDKCGNTS